MIQLPAFLLALPRNPVVAVGLPLCFGSLSGMGTAKEVRGPWYQNLSFPPGRPPRQAFPIVWTALYISMGYASHLAVKALDSSVSLSARDDLLLGITLYYAQLAMNFAWSPLFFNSKQVGFALIDSTLLAGTTYYMTKLWDTQTKGQTTYFLLPYCLWLTYATYLNGSIWWLNKGKPKYD